jgi:ribonuclease-3
LKLRARIKEIERICGHKFDREDLVISAITHPSAAEGKSVSASYERLEFLGDSLVGGIVAMYVFTHFPDMNEGEMSTMRTTLISGDTLARISEDLGVAPCLILGHSERGTHARGMRKALEDVYEALVGALYVDAGMDVARDFVTRTLLCYATPDLARRPMSPKSRLQEVAQRDFHCGPTYKLVGEEGPAHTPTFTTVAFVEGRRVGRGKGSTKKESESAAALDALSRLGYTSEVDVSKDRVMERAKEGVDVP